MVTLLKLKFSIIENGNGKIAILIDLCRKTKQGGFLMAMEIYFP